MLVDEKEVVRDYYKEKKRSDKEYKKSKKSDRR